MQSNYSGGGCYNCSNWDGGSAATGFVAGAVVAGSVAAASRPPTAAPAPAPVAPPCNVAPVTVIILFGLVHILPEKIAEKKGHPKGQGDPSAVPALAVAVMPALKSEGKK